VAFPKCFPEGFSVNDKIEKVPLRFRSAVGVLRSFADERREFQNRIHVKCSGDAFMSISSNQPKSPPKEEESQCIITLWLRM
jgi:hypothetical protein